MVYRVRSSAPIKFMDSKWDPLRLQCLNEGDSHKAKSSLYRDESIKELEDIYKGKCAYCERSRGFELQVDHYRPKRKRDNETEQEYNQPGYFWLAYEWSNLIPLCSICNVKKSNKFPLVGWSEHNRVSCVNPVLVEDLKGKILLPELNKIENPLLLHPELDKEPESHFKFLNDGHMIGRTDKGKETVKLLQLNRSDLIADRLRILKSNADQINRSMDDFIHDNDESRLKGALGNIFYKLTLAIDVDHRFSLFHLYIYRYPAYYIGKYLASSVIVTKILDYFEEYKSSQNIL